MWLQFKIIATTTMQAGTKKILPQPLKHTIKSILHFFMKKSEEQIKRQIDAHEIISFDVFDTLIERKCGRPPNVFGIMGGQLGEKSFARRRVEAERIARTGSSQEEVTLGDIYESFAGLTVEQAERYKAIELECEKSQAVQKAIGRHLFEYAKGNAKRILIISDMYLPETFIGSLLKENGYRGYEKLYVSSEYGLQKKTGSLYKEIKGDLQIEGETWLHIGDNPIADGFGTGKMSIASSIL